MEFKPWKIAVHRRKNAASQADGLPGFLQAVLEGYEPCGRCKP